MAREKVFYEVIVGNIGKVHEGSSRAAALKAYNTYVRQSKSGYGRASGEQVSLWKDNEPIKEYYGSGMSENPTGLAEVTESDIRTMLRKLPVGSKLIIHKSGLVQAAMGRKR